LENLYAVIIIKNKSYMVRRVSSPKKLRTSANMKKASTRMNGVDVKTRDKIIKAPVKVEKGTTLDDCNLDELTLD
jgi:hypothetical protein